MPRGCPPSPNTPSLIPGPLRNLPATCDVSTYKEVGIYLYSTLYNKCYATPCCDTFFSRPIPIVRDQIRTARPSPPNHPLRSQRHDARRHIIGRVQLLLLTIFPFPLHLPFRRCRLRRRDALEVQYQPRDVRRRHARPGQRVGGVIAIIFIVTIAARPRRQHVDARREEVDGSTIIAPGGPAVVGGEGADGEGGGGRGGGAEARGLAVVARGGDGGDAGVAGGLDDVVEGLGVGSSFFLGLSAYEAYVLILGIMCVHRWKLTYAYADDGGCLAAFGGDVVHCPREAVHDLRREALPIF